MDEERIKKLVRELLIEVGEDPTREGLTKTPERIANAYKAVSYTHLTLPTNREV